MKLADVSGRLAGKVAIVIGAGQTPGETIGNGKAMARLFAQAGAKVLCVDRDQARLEEALADISQEGGTAKGCIVDITEADQVQSIAATCIEQFKKVDILVNNVGIGGNGDGPPHKLTEKAFDRILTVNLRSAWTVTKAIMPLMLEQKSGSIINISSLASIAGGFQMAYEVSKAGMNRMTRSVALSGASRGVRCNAITPGLMDTPMAISGIAAARGISMEELRKERNKQVPMKFMGNGWDTAYAALFLASDESRFVTGMIMPVDGGASARVG